MTSTTTMRSTNSAIISNKKISFCPWLFQLTLVLFGLQLSFDGYAQVKAVEKVPQQAWSVNGIQQPAKILVDRWGVPHIFAENENDLFFAQGFNAARDRLFQLDLWRRRGLGQLTEAFGPQFLEQDRAARLFLYRGDMKKEWAAYGSHAQRISTNFVAGDQCLY